MSSLVRLTEKLSILLLIATMSTASAADRWTQFRGPKAGSIKELAHPLRWSESDNRAWTVEIPGGGWSSPIVVGETNSSVSPRP